jgi:hypothetical protein
MNPNNPNNPNMNPELSRLALSLWCSDRRIESLPRVTVYPQWERVEIVPLPLSLRYYSAGMSFANEGI